MSLWTKFDELTNTTQKRYRLLGSICALWLCWQNIKLCSFLVMALQVQTVDGLFSLYENVASYTSIPVIQIAMEFLSVQDFGFSTLISLFLKIPVSDWIVFGLCILYFSAEPKPKKAGWIACVYMVLALVAFLGLQAGLHAGSFNEVILIIKLLSSILFSTLALMGIGFFFFVLMNFYKTIHE